MTLHAAMKRKAERERIAQLFEAMAARAGAIAERAHSTLRSRGFTLYLRKDGASVMLHLDGDSHVGAFLGHWFFDSRRGRLFPTGFAGAGDGSRPHHKATMLADHAEDLCAMIEGAFMRIDDGTAFVTEPAHPTADLSPEALRLRLWAKQGKTAP